MDNQRILAFGGLALIIMLIYQQWQFDYNPEYRKQHQQQINSQNTVSTKSETANAQDLPEVKQAQNPLSSSDTPDVADIQSEQITVETDLLKLKIDTVGGTINYSELLHYPVSLEDKKDKVKLLNIDETHFYIAQSGLRANKGILLPNHYSHFKVKQNQYHLAKDQKELRVPLYWKNDQGIEVVKTYIFTRDSYQVKVEYDVKNNSGKAIQFASYEQLQKKPQGRKSNFLYTYSGGVIYDAIDKYQKITYEDFADFQSKTVDAGWLALIQHYFVTAWIPNSQEKNTYYTKVINKNGNKRYLLGSISATKVLSPDKALNIKAATLFVGPKEQHRLEKIEGLRLVVDYGILTIISDPLFWALNELYQILGNWGWAIIVLTLLIKLVFYKLSEASYRSMARMRKLQPKIEALKQRYGDDRQKMGMAQMELFKKEKVNPLGGCLPIFIQMPVFIGLYWMIMETVELRQAPWILWIQDLSIADPYFILPLIMGVTMIIQQKLNPAPIDPIQQKIMMILPIVFTFFFAFFPAGLVLYWVVNNILSISQQYYITRIVLAEK